VTLVKDFPERELMGPGHLACQGCGGTINMRYLLKVLGPNTVGVIPACCMTIITGQYPFNTLGVPIMHTAFETAASAASGVRAALDQRGKQDTHVFAFAGDGGTFDIGLQALSGAAERNENFIYCCYDNEAYMNTGIQRSSATPTGAWTTTTPTAHPKTSPKKDIVQILAGHRVPYVATLNPAFPEDYFQKLRRAASLKGTRFLHMLSGCPPGWKVDSHLSIQAMRLATESKVFPLYEVFDGDRYRITHEPKGIPVKEYLGMQGRFRHLTDEQTAAIQEQVDHDWERLQQKASVQPFVES
jgi:pyruvate/2-oxoacid:ferredoxin oxidoreductase beta subunit